MVDETVQSAILQLQAQLTGIIGQMKDMARRRTEPADPQVLGNLALQAAQIQGAIQAVTQLREDLVETGRDALRLSEEPASTTVEVQEEDDEELPSVITQEVRDSRRVKPRDTDTGEESSES